MDKKEWMGVQGAPTQEEIIERWTELGFVDGLDEVQKHNVANFMEECARLIVIAGDSYREIQAVAFPVIRKIFSAYEHKFLDSTVISAISTMFLRFWEEDFKYPEGFNGDFEAYKLKKYCNDYLDGKR